MLEIETLIQSLKIITTVAILFVWVIRYDNIKKEFLEYNLPRWFRDLIGILKISFCIMLHSNEKQVILIGSMGILILMVGAVFTHVRMRSVFRKYIASVTMLTISGLIFYFTI